jgi:LPS sulfotransferase NodH
MPTRTNDPRDGSNYQVGPTKYFVLAGSQRSGSNFFREVMCTNPVTAVHGEILWPYPLPNVWHNYLRTVAPSINPPVFDADAIRLLDDYFVHLTEETKRGHPHLRDQLGCVGVDIKYNQLRFIAPLIRDLTQGPFLFDYLKKRDIPVVHIRRENLLHQALSLLIAQKRDVYHNYGAKKFEGALELDPYVVVSRMGWLAGEIHAFQAQAKKVRLLDISYESVASACESVEPGEPIQGNEQMAKIAEFLSIPNEFRSPTTISRVVNRPYREILQNYKAIVKAVKKSEYAEYADSI